MNSSSDISDPTDAIRLQAKKKNAILWGKPYVLSFVLIKRIFS